MRTFPTLAAVAALTLAACGGPRECKLEDPGSCPKEMLCEKVQGQEAPLCFLPVQLEGTVFDLANREGVKGAQVIALDANGAAVGPSAQSGEGGKYTLRVPSERTDQTGAFVAKKVFLRASAQDFVPFPSGTRVSLPIDTAAATRTEEGKPFLASGGLNDLGLQKLPATEQGRPTVSGKVEVSPGQRGVMVVLEGTAAATTLAGPDGAFALFNVAPGAYRTLALSKGFNYTPVDLTVEPGTDKSGLEIKKSGAASATLTGSVQLVAGANNAGTSIVMVVESTFNEALMRGEVPPGLRAPEPGLAPNITGAFSISGIPDGKYVVLAAFENDGNVRDPDPGISGTQVQRLTVAGGVVSGSPSFKVTGAVQMIGPGAADAVEVVSGTPTFSWKPYSNADDYRLTVLDALGQEAWSHGGITGSGGANLSVAYGGPALTAGAFYQWRVTALRRGGPTSLTEDLKGLFTVQ